MAKKIVRYGRERKSKYDDAIYTHYVKTCEWCGNEFECRRKDAKYCHSLCQHRASVARREKEQIEETQILSPIRQKDKKNFDSIFTQRMPSKESKILSSLTPVQKKSLWERVCAVRDSGAEPFKTMYVDGDSGKDIDLAQYLLSGEVKPQKIKVLWFNF